MSRRYLVAALVLPWVVVFATARAAGAGSYALPECDALSGSAVEAAAASRGVPVVCEPRPEGAPATAGLGWWDGSTVHLWVSGVSDGKVVRWMAAHELGHAFADQTGHYPDWQAVRGGSGQTVREDFAESFAEVNFYEAGCGYRHFLGPLTDAERDLMRSWWTGVVTAPATEPAIIDLPAPEPAPPVGTLSSPPAVIDLPVSQPQVGTLTVAPPVVVLLATQEARPWVAALLAGLREAGA